MKKIIVFALTCIFLSSCGKYEEGPGFSLLTKKSRVTGKWIQTDLSLQNELGEDSTIDYNYYSINIDKKGTWIASWDNTNTSTEEFGWSWGDKKEYVSVRNEYDMPECFTKLYILKLTNSEMILKRCSGNGFIIRTFTKD